MAMAGTAKLLFSACLLALCQQGAAAQASVGQPPILVQELKTVRASGKVMTALWTRRTNSYTLQLVFALTRTARTTATRVEAAPQKAGSVARVQVWLLRADGTQAWPTYQSPPPKPEQINCVRCISYEVSYSFPLLAGKDAVAAAVQINDEFFIDQLEPFGSR
jgi:hypothetical protein